MQTTNRLKVLLVDDNPDFLEVAADFLSSQNAFEVVGVAESGSTALEMASEFLPQLVIMDLVMPGWNGLETTRRLKMLPSPPVVIIMTLYDEQEFSSLALEAGANQFITKSEFGEALLPALHKLFPDLQHEPAHECA